MPEGDPSALELIQQFNALFDAADFHAVRSTLENRSTNTQARETLGSFQNFQERSVDPDLVIDYTHLAPGEINPGGSTLYRGWEGWLEHWRVWFEAWDAIETDERHQLEIDRERVLLWSVGRVRGRGSGAVLPWTSTYAIWTVKGGRLVRIDGYSTKDEALAAAANFPRR